MSTKKTFSVADDLTTLSVEDITTSITAGNEALDALFAIENPTDDDIAEAERISAAIQALQTEQDSRVTAAAERATKMQTLRDAHSATDEADEEVEDEATEAEVVASEEVVEPEAEVEAEKEVAVVAAAPKKNVRQIVATRKERPVVEEKTQARITLTAAADVPGFSSASDIPNIETLSQAVINRMRAFPQPEGREGGSLMQFGVASLRKPFDDDHIIDRGHEDQDVIDRAGKEASLPGGSLVAAGGWCAPSETFYDFCGGESTDGLWDVPEVQVRRGGIRYTRGPDFSTLYAEGFTQTETQAIAGTVKTCYEVECPDFTEIRLDVVGLCIKVPILTNAAYPELVQRTISLALIAQQHKVSAALIVKALAIATAVTPATLGGTVSDSLAALELQAETLRGLYHLPLAATMEVVLPYWVRAAMRADLAGRTGVDLLAVSDEQLNAYFRARKLNVQWVYNWQPLVANEEGYPASVVALIYPAGSFVKGVSDVITLNAVYDAAELSVNRYTGLFTEEGILLANRCYEAKKITIPLCQAGKTGAASLTGCYTLTP